MLSMPQAGSLGSRNFAFSFYISLKAAPEIKFDYDRRTFRGQGSASR